MLATMTENQPVSFSSLFPQATPDALDLLSKLLQFNPQKRISAEEALEHPYIRQFHDRSIETVARETISIQLNDNTKVITRSSDCTLLLLPGIAKSCQVLLLYHESICQHTILRKILKLGHPHGSG